MGQYLAAPPHHKLRSIGLHQDYVLVASNGGTVDLTGMSFLSQGIGFGNTFFQGGFGVVGLSGGSPSDSAAGNLAYFDGFSYGNGGTSGGTFSAGDATIAFSQVGDPGGGDDFLFFPANWTAGVNTLDAFSFTTLAGFESSISTLGYIANSSAVWTATSGDTVTIQISPIPEPSSSLILGLGTMGLLARRRRIK
jgi:hypothetical protein